MYIATIQNLYGNRPTQSSTYWLHYITDEHNVIVHVATCDDDDDDEEEVVVILSVLS